MQKCIEINLKNLYVDIGNFRVRAGMTALHVLYLVSIFKFVHSLNVNLGKYLMTI